MIIDSPKLLHRAVWCLGLVALACLTPPFGTLVCATENDLAARRRQIEQMNPAELDRLARAQQRFLELTSAEQRRLRHLHEQIEQNPRATELVRVMDAYHQWLTTLSPGERAELLELPLDQRIDRIKQLRQEQKEAAAMRSIGLADVRELSHWLRAHYEQPVTAVLNGQRRQRYEQLPPAVRGMILLDLYARMLRIPDTKRQWRLPDQEQIDDLHRRLSEPAQRRLDSATTLEGQQRIVVGWIRDVGRRMSSREWSSHIANVSDQELTRFFEEELDPNTREQLLMLPAESMWRELRHEYLRHELPELNPRLSPGAGPSGSGRSPRTPSGR